MEKNGRAGAETSSRNSEVIHAGIYYPNDSDKTRMCIEGRQMLYKFCATANVPHRKVGKWIFSTSKSQSHYLDSLQVKCKELGVPLRKLSATEIHTGEPLLTVVDAVESPETGIVDSHSYMQALEASVSQSGSDVLCNTKLLSAESRRPGSPFEAKLVSAKGEVETILADSIVNAGGLHSDSVARAIMADATPGEYRLFYLKGHYFSYSGKPLVSRLAYPIPDPDLKTLGTHATLDLAGRYANWS